MKVSWVGFLALVVAVVAQNLTAEEQAGLEQAQALMQSMPKCGLSCLQGAVAASPCAPTDLACSCTNTTITDQVSLCVAQGCSTKDGLSTKNVTSVLCNQPVRDHGYLASSIGIAGFVIAMLAYILRLISRGIGEGTFMGNLGWDDFVMTIAMIVVIPVSALSIVLADLGLGQDMWKVPFDNVTKILQIYYYDELLYLAGLPIVKISMCLTYLRIFQTKAFRIWVYVAIGLNVGAIIAFDLITVFQCDPIPYSWTRWDGEHPGSCGNINAQIFAAAAVNVVLDILVIGLPMPQLWKMSMNWRKKILVMMMFGVGFFVTIVSILRLRYIIKFGHSTNITWDYTQIGYWSTIELHTSVLAACMPGIRRLIKAFLPKVMGSTSRGLGASSNLSGPTALNSGNDKIHAQVNVRRKSSDLSNFIPLHDYSNSASNHHVRNFSQPYGTSSHVTSGVFSSGGHGPGGYGYGYAK